MNMIEYLNWLDFFTRTNRKFYDDDLKLKNPKLIPFTDYKMVRKLRSFFSKIHEYANEHSINNKVLDYDCFTDIFYIIEYNNIVYRIGIYAGEHNCTYCERIKNEFKDNWKDIIDLSFLDENDMEF